MIVLKSTQKLYMSKIQETVLSIIFLMYQN